MSKRFAALALGLAAMTALSACYQHWAPMRHETATRLYRAAFMNERHIEANDFEITVFERVYDKGGNARVYIEGDGPGYTSNPIGNVGDAAGTNPTPVYPVGLHLATYDNARNVIAMARPCQYAYDHTPPTQDNPKCQPGVWQKDRYSPEVIDTMNKALDDVKTRYGLKKFELVGFEGGGVIALALTLHRDDIVSVRTVATPLDHDILTGTMKIKPFDGSVNAAEFASRVAHVPQRHFVGHLEEKIPYQAMFDSYAKAEGDLSCTHFNIVRKASDAKGFVAQWPELLQMPVECGGQ
jgi:pimeloyl-ACP methyl ester carboxylesterase